MNTVLLESLARHLAWESKLDKLKHSNLPYCIAHSLLRDLLRDESPQYSADRKALAETIIHSRAAARRFHLRKF